MNELLSGKKTHLTAALMALATGAQVMGYLTVEQFASLMGFLNAMGLSTLRSGVTKSGPQS